MSTKAGQLHADGHEVDVDKRFVQLSLVRDNGSAAGIINWFGVHPTAMGNHDWLISSDIKGYASLGFEKIMGTRYVPDTGDTPAGNDNFVAAFAQSDEGDTIPDLFVFDKDVNGGDGPGQGVPYRFRFGTDDPYDFDQPGYKRGERKAVETFGAKQLAQALKQFGQGSSLSGPVDYRFYYVDMNDVTVTDPAISDHLSYADLPSNLYDDPKSTCTSGIGQAFLAGGANGTAFGAAGFVCVDDAPSPYTDAIRNHYNGIYNGNGGLPLMKDGVIVTVPINGVATFTVTTPLVCAAQMFRPEYGCQKEKPTVANPNTEHAPFQIFRIGNLAVLGVPWEVTTMAARRLRQTVLDALSPVGVDTVVIAGLSNAYLHYMTTREEYSAQMYEGASTLYGPWQLAAAQQEARRLALTMANGQPAPTGVTPAAIALGNPSPITTDAPAEFGKLINDAKSGYTQGDAVEVSFVAGYPGNDLKLMSSYLYVERQNGPSKWDVVATDKDPELLFIWNWASNPVSIEAHVVDSSTAEAIWTIPKNMPAGTYRIRHEGVSRTSASQPPAPYEGRSSPFKITGTPQECPY
ncbi:MAG: neutral/alkaline non-lysosomal ceramidase N-terminal domain-containing protein [Gammaproteobacteria bacterium]|nr:neutral/alkaline non-lysosomal ceramidase N-terminal domain-containing protein [Gammaproteobacteria bacterium]